jgi:hypothetical protein
MIYHLFLLGKKSCGRGGGSGKILPDFFPVISVYIPFTPTSEYQSGRKECLIIIPEPQKSPLARLILFMVCLGITGSLVAGAHYYAVDLPEQARALQAPVNVIELKAGCNICMANCVTDKDRFGCEATCLLLVCGGDS